MVQRRLPAAHRAEGHVDLQQRQAHVESLTDQRLLNTIAMQGDNLGYVSPH